MPIVSATPPITAQNFRADYPEFADANAYPDSGINYWLAVATILLNACRWGQLLILGMENYVAHNLVLEKQAQDAASIGGWPGVSKGVISSETPGAVSISYDSSVALETDGSFYNLTTYGVRFLHLARMAGAGGIQVGPGFGGPGYVPGTGIGGGFAWFGPNPMPGWFG